MVDHLMRTETPRIQQGPAKGTSWNQRLFSEVDRYWVITAKEVEAITLLEAGFILCIYTSLSVRHSLRSVSMKTLDL